MIKNIKVSVIVPVYNTEKYLYECLDSLINQTLKDIEIICIDDGSTDNSLKILNEYAKKDRRIKVFTQENCGQGAARNKGMDFACGEFIYFMDSDDYIDLDTLSVTYNVCKEKNLDIAIFQLLNFDDTTGEFYETDDYNMEYLAEEFGENIFNYRDLSDLIFKIAVSPCNKLFNREFILNSGAKFPNGLKFEDNVFYFKAILSAERMFFIKKQFYKRRRREGSTTSVHDNKHIDIIEITDRVYNIFKELSLLDEFSTRICNFKFNGIWHWFRQIDEEYQIEFYLKIKQNFKLIDDDESLSNFYMENLTRRNKSFFKNILDSNNLNEFNLLIEIFYLKNDIRSKNKKIKSLKKKNQKLKKEVKKLKKLNGSIINSTSWKLTSPFRKIVNIFKKGLFIFKS